MKPFVHAKMGTCRGGINSFLTLLGLALFAGCASPSGSEDEKAPKDAYAVVQVYGESSGSPDWRSRKIEIVRSAPITMNINSEAFIDERDVARAQVVDSVGGFAIVIELTSHGLMALNMETASLRGRRMAVFGRWNEKKVSKARWLAAPMITRPIENGVIAFTPDCTREEADIFVLGLNNVAIKLENQAKPPKKGKKPKEQADPDFDRFNQKPKP